MLIYFLWRYNGYFSRNKKPLGMEGLYFKINLMSMVIYEFDFTFSTAMDISFGLTISPKSCFSHRTKDMLSMNNMGIRGTELRTVIDNTVSRAPDCNIPAVISASRTAHAKRFHRFGSASLRRFLAEILEST